MDGPVTAAEVFGAFPVVRNCLCWMVTHLQMEMYYRVHNLIFQVAEFYGAMDLEDSPEAGGS